MSRFDELTSAMTWLGKQPDTIFLGQSVAYPGNALYKTLKYVPMEKRIELPVIEDCQLGFSIGLSLVGKVPISIFPRMDFLLCATNQLVNHLDKLEEMTHGEYHAKVIIRTCIGSTKPLYPGVQHCGDYTEGLKALCKNVKVIRLCGNIVEEYMKVYEGNESAILIEEADSYGLS
jgi:pyruvate/2-oxoglutarate/acetoin dehydrogenase E1 component